ncbi:MAG: hypothetical protein IPF47_01460 [Gemmatimonadetes bacterium]|nr:hypothetical protein [Gemmatimonadota bacterium]
MRLFRVPVSLRALALPTLLPLALAAQGAPPKGYQFAIEDYARAERFLGQTMNPLVSGTAGRPTWLPDGRFWYRATTANGSSFVLMNPAKRTRAAAFDHNRPGRGPRHRQRCDARGGPTALPHVRSCR